MKYLQYVNVIILLILSAQSLASTELIRINTTSLDKTAFTIQDLNVINKFYTSGNNAWAIDNSMPNKVAYFNGSTWAQAMSIKKVDAILSMFPAYEDSSQYHYAWAVGISKDPTINNYLLAYFNGTSWTTYDDISVDKIAVKNGNIWIKPSYLSSTEKPYILHASITDPFKFNKINYTETYDNAEFESMSAGGAANDPRLYALYSDKNSNPQRIYLVSYRPSGTGTVLLTTYRNSDLVSYPLEIAAHDNEITVTIANSFYRATTLYSKDNGHIWSTHETPFNEPNYYNSIPMDYYPRAFRGLFCGTYWLNSPGGQIGKSFCQNFNANNDDIVIYDYGDISDVYNITAIVTPDKFTVSTREGNPALLEYDYATAKRIDLRIDQVAASISDTRAMTQHRYIACGVNKITRKPAVFLYDKNHWVSIDLSLAPTNSSCQMSSGSDGVTHYLIDNNVWIY